MWVGVVVLSVVKAGTGWVDTGAAVGGMVGVVAEIEVPTVDAAADDDGVVSNGVPVAVAGAGVAGAGVVVGAGVVSNGVPAAVVAAGGVGTAIKYDLICVKIIFLNK